MFNHIQSKSDRLFERSAAVCRVLELGYVRSFWRGCGLVSLFVAGGVLSGYTGSYAAGVQGLLVAALIAAVCVIVWLVVKNRGLHEVISAQRAENERMEFMFEHSPLVTIFFDKDGGIIDCNDEVAKKLDISEKGLFISNFHMFSPEFQPNGRRSMEYLKEILARGLSDDRIVFDWMLKDIHGNMFPCEVIGSSGMFKGEPVLVLYARDITEIMAQKEKMIIAEENSRAKTRFLARMSHEIRTPISAVLGIAEIQLQNPLLPFEVGEAFERIYDSAGVLLNIINDILDISRIEAGKMDIIPVKYEVTSLTVDIIHLQLVYQGSKDIKFTVNIDENMPAALVGDGLRIKQILSNILTNAFKYTDKGEVVLEIYCEREAGRDSSVDKFTTLVLQVSDTGRGMTKRQLNTLSQDEYSRFHEVEDRFTLGTGLGMPIVYSLVSLMGGKILVDSEVGRGTCFNVKIPQMVFGTELLGRASADSLRQYEKDALVQTKRINFVPEPMPYGRVLVVDDIDTNLYVARGLLRFYSLNVETLTSGIAAIEKVQEGEEYDIIFMDQMMPELDGIQTVQKIRQMGYRGPIVALTANALIGQAEEFMRNGFDGFLSKPIQIRQLNSILMKFVRAKQPPEVLELAKNLSKDAVNQYRESFNTYVKSSDIYSTICKDFLRTQRDVIREIKESVEAGDVLTAHRIAHTLKGLAGLLGEMKLAGCAQKCEDSLKNGHLPKPELGALENEMDVIFKKLSLKFSDELLARAEAEANEEERSYAPIDVPRVASLFDDLESSLEMGRGDTLQMVEVLSEIPGTKQLIEQIEDYDFGEARQTLAELRMSLEV